ncbi:MAG: presenilin family intramembrane aspartyl protease [Candidatus Thermoplasmatota archaeon]|nr:presenilin family intramembrane aspartyl protease [Candidatus Thermoplasmatota archaeon]
MNRSVQPTIIMGAMMVAAHLVAIALVLPFKGYYQTANENPNDPSLMFLYIGMMLLITGILLLVFKFGVSRGLKYILYFMFSIIIFQTLYLPFAYAIYYAGAGGSVAGDLGALASVITTIVIMAVYAMKKTWYITNIVGVLIAGGAIAMLGVNFSILPIFIFLIILAVYDYIAVYKTKHMLTLAEGIIPMGVPILLSAPKKGIKLKPGHTPKVRLNDKKTGTGEKPKERDAMYMGLGDIILPGLLIVSAIAFLPMHAGLGAWGPGIVAIGTMLGILFSYIFLSWQVMKGKPHAGLPFLNTGAMGGYIICYVIIYQNLTLGMSFSW